MNTDTEDIREEIEHLSGYGTMQSPMGNNNLYLPYSPRAKQIFAYAGDEAKRLGAQKDWYRAFIIRLLRDEEILASRILVNLGLSLSKCVNYY